MNFFAVLNQWLHLVSVVLWIGGVAFQIFIYGPLVKPADPSPAFLTQISTRFRQMVGPLLLVLVITGGINLGLRRSGHESVPAGYISALGVKILLVSAVASMYIFDLIRKRPDEDKSDRRPKEDQPPFPGYAFTKLTLIIGLVIIFLASMLRQWKF
jgi:putative copper export protein